MKIFTIDDWHSRDLDDAIMIEPHKDGTTIGVTVFIADVAGTVPKGSPLDERTRQRVETRYWREGNTPMLPRELSEDKLSLRPHQKRDTLAVHIAFGADLEPVEPIRLGQAAITSAAKLAYAEIPGILADATHPLYKPLAAAERLAQRLLAHRRDAGALTFYDLNEGWTTTEEGFLLKLERARANVGYIIIQELMILANSQIAKYCAEREIPVLFRNHTTKSIAPDRAELLRQLDDARLHPEMIGTLRARTHLVMNRADYGRKLVGHYGLSLPAYLHFTSPIRRYADLVTHRQLRAHILGEPLPYSHEEVDELATHINAKLAEHRDRKDQEQRDDRYERAGRHVEATDVMVLLSLKPKDFERALKVALRPGAAFRPDVAEAVRHKAQAGTLAVLDAFLMLCTSSPKDANWAAVRDDVMRWLVAHPWDAISVAGMGLAFGWSPLDFRHKRVGPDHASRFEVTASVRIPNTLGETRNEDAGTGAGAGADAGTGAERAVHTSPAVVASSLRAAKARAATVLMAQIAGTSIPTWNEPSPRESQAQAQAQGLQSRKGNGAGEAGSGRDAIAVLQELAQAKRLPAPMYGWQRTGGEDHVPEMVVTCTFNGIERTSPPATNKKVAKHAAARLVLDALGVSQP